MTLMQEVGLEALLTFGPIILALALAGLAWVVKWTIKERRAWNEACEEAEEVWEE